MDINIIVPALVTGMVTALGSILGFIATQNATKQKDEQARTKQFTDLEERLTKKLTSHKEEYMTEIASVKDSINEMRAQYQTTVATVSIQIANLEKKQDLHNQVISRTYELEKQVGILDNREKVSEHRLEDLEKAK